MSANLEMKTGPNQDVNGNRLDLAISVSGKKVKMYVKTDYIKKLKRNASELAPDASTKGFQMQNMPCSILI
jgi:hypothetical protein